MDKSDIVEYKANKLELEDAEIMEYIHYFLQKKYDKKLVVDSLSAID